MSSIEETLAKTQFALTCYILPICFVLGIFGNIFNIIIFIHKKLRLNSCSVYFIAASVTNLLIIFFGITPTISAVYIIDPSFYLSWACKLKLYGLHSLLMMSRLYIVMACIDRYTFSSSNPRLRQFSRRKVALKILPIIPILWLLIPIHMLIFVDVQVPYVRCGTSGTYSLVYSVYSFICSSLPLILMISFSTLAVHNLRKINQRVLPINNNQQPISDIRRRKYHYQITKMLIGEVIIYLISNILHPTTTLYMSLTAVPKGSPPKSSVRLAIEGFIIYLTWGFLIYLNSCSTFYINFCVSKVFRLRFYRLWQSAFNWCIYSQRELDQRRANATTGDSIALRSNRR